MILLFSSAAPAALVWDFTAPVPNGYTLTEVQSGGGLWVGDKLFANFDVVTTATPGVTGPTADTIAVRGVNVEGNFGLEFFGGWATGSGQSINTNLSFSVGTDGSHTIHGSHLWMTGFGATGGGLVSMVENLYASNPALTSSPASIANKIISYAAGDPQNQTSDAASFSPLDTIWVVKDITVRDGSDEGLAHVSRFYQTFVQTPEPGTLVLLGLGTALVFGRVRRRTRVRGN